MVTAAPLVFCAYSSPAANAPAAGSTVSTMANASNRLSNLFLFIVTPPQI